MNKKLMLILSLTLMSICALSAQITNYYTFSATTETYSAITGTTIPTAIGDNVMSNPVDIGFTFNYGLNSYTQVKVSSNGYVTLGTAPGSSANNMLISTICPILAPLWDDTYLQGSARYVLTGTAPNRVFTVQFAGVKWNTSSNTNFSYQVKMYESSKIEFIYGPAVGTPTNANASIGLNMLPGGFGNFYSITPGNPATASDDVENSSVTVWPGTNTKYVFNPPAPLTNDLAALSISGNQTPTAGVSYNYTVNVRNSGTAAQSNYTVKIVSGATELASVAGPVIAPLTTTSVNVPWIPTTAGTISISGKVVLTGDENTANNTSSALNLIVQTEGTVALTIGDGTESARKPIDVSYLNSMYEVIFPASEITANGTITGISFYNNFTNNLPNMHTKIWLGTTTLTDLSAGWIPAFQMVQVFDGNVNYPSEQNIIHITLNASNPFTYTGGNLVMLVNRPLDTNYYSSSNVFLCQTVGSNRARNAYSDATNYDPNNMGTVGTVSGQFPKTTFYLVPALNPSFSVTPLSGNFGQVVINTTATQQFSIYNSGGGTLTISNITLSGSPMFHLQGLPTLPVNLGSGQNATFTAQYIPTAVGTHTGTINITDNLAKSVHTVSLSGTGFDPTINAMPYTQNFDQITVPNLPLGWQKLTTGTGTVTTVNTESFSTPNSVLLNNSNSALGPFLIVPPVNATIPLNTLKIKFRAKGAGGYYLGVGVMTNPQDANTFMQVQNVTLASDWVEYTVEFRTYSGTGTYIAFKHNQGGNNRNIYIDNVVLEALLQNDLAALSITGDNTPNVGFTTNYNITVFNCGLNTQNDYQVKLMKEGGIELGSVEGPTLAGNNQVIVTIPWTPTVIENTNLYGKIVLASDQNTNNDQTSNLMVTVQNANTALVVVGSGNQLSNYAPVNMADHSSLYENIYRQDELNQAGLISIVNFYNVFVNNCLNKATKIWLGLTTQNDLSNGWIPANQLTLVFDGNVDFPSGTNTISIVLQQPFTLAAGYNLVMMVQRCYDPLTYGFWENFYCQTDTYNRTRLADSSEEIDPNNPPVGNFSAQFPKTGFYLTPGGAGNLEGSVYTQDNQALQNAVILLQNGPQAVTDANGHYAFSNIFARDYAATAVYHGYDELTQYITVMEDSTVTLNFILVPTPMVSVTGTIFGSDNLSTGITGATITLSGYDNYEAVTTTGGGFTITGVYANHTYSYQVSATGYQTASGSINVTDSNFDLGNLILTEIAFPPENVNASISANHTSVELIWLAPVPLGKQANVVLQSRPETSNNDRALIGYKIWRLQPGEEQNEQNWTLLTQEPITSLRYTDAGWGSLAEGTYKWAVKGLYTNNIVSEPTFSNTLRTLGILTGIVRNVENVLISGAIITVGTQTTSTGADGRFTLYLPYGTYSVTCTYTGYYANTQFNVVIVTGQTTELDFTIVPVANSDQLAITATSLIGNSPNPFNPDTIIRYDIKESCPVLLEIYNMKGQVVGKLVDEVKGNGHYTAVWNGRDNKGSLVSSGIYFYRLQAGSYNSIRKMTLKK